MIRFTIITLHQAVGLWENGVLKYRPTRIKYKDKF